MDEQQGDVNRRLEDLEMRIEEMRSGLEQHGAIDDRLRQEWEGMLRQHADIRRRLREGKAEGTEAGETLAQDIDVLRHAFFRWVARVDERFKPPGRS